MSDTGLTPKAKVDGRYELVERLEDRGAAEVWKARDPDFKTRFSMLKVLAALPAGAASVPPALQDLVKRLRAIRHPALLPVVGLGITGARPYLSFAWFEGASLAAAVRDEGGVSVEALAKAFDALCDVVHACHEASLMHGRINPGCVLTQRGDRAVEVRLVDVGLAPWVDQGTAFLYRECVAPESETARTQEPSVDVFGIGATLRRALAVSDGASSWVEPFERFRGREDAPKAVWDVIGKATRPSPAERFESVAGLRAALDTAWGDDARLPVKRAEQPAHTTPPHDDGEEPAREAPSMLWDAPPAPPAPREPPPDEQRTTFRLPKLPGDASSVSPVDAPGAPGAPLSLDGLLGDAKPAASAAPSPASEAPSGEPNPWATDVLRREVPMPTPAPREPNPWSTDVLRREVPIPEGLPEEEITTNDDRRVSAAPVETSATPLSLDSLLGGAPPSGPTPNAAAPEVRASSAEVSVVRTEYVPQASIQQAIAVAGASAVRAQATPEARSKRTLLWIALAVVALLLLITMVAILGGS